MLVGIISDLHLENALGNIVIPECDLLLLAGDIINANNTLYKRNTSMKLDKRYRKFFETCENMAKRTLFIAGNHESYGVPLGDTQSLLRDRLEPYQNITLLDNNSVVIDGVAIFGATLWTDMNKSDPLVMGLCQKRINDYEHIYRKETGCYLHGIRVEETIRENDYTRKKISQFLSGVEDGHKSIVMSHHAPSWVCVRDDYKCDLISYAFANTGLDDMILDGDGPDIWVHGHTHLRHDFMHGNKTRMICHARGYWHQESAAKQCEVKLINI